MTKLLDKKKYLKLYQFFYHVKKVDKVNIPIFAVLKTFGQNFSEFCSCLYVFLMEILFQYTVCIHFNIF